MVNGFLQIRIVGLDSHLDLPFKKLLTSRHLDLQITAGTRNRGGCRQGIDVVEKRSLFRAQDLTNGSVQQWVAVQN